MGLTANVINSESTCVVHPVVIVQVKGIKFRALLDSCSLLRRQLLWHPKWQTFEKSPSKRSNTVANGELMLFWPSSNKIKGIGSGERRIKGDLGGYPLSPDPIPLILLPLGQNNINSPFATVLLLFDGDFSKVCHLGCHKSCLRRRLR